MQLSQALPQRELSRGGGQVGDVLRVQAERKRPFGAVLQRRLPRLAEAPGQAGAHVFRLDVRQRLSAPQGERLVEQGQRLDVVGAAGLLDQLDEPEGVHVPGIDAQPVSVAHPVKGYVVLGPDLPEQRAQPRDVRLDAGTRGPRWIIRPRQVDHAAHRHDMVRLQEQDGQDHPLDAAPELDGPAVLVRLHGPEQPEPYRGGGRRASWAGSLNPPAEPAVPGASQVTRTAACRFRARRTLQLHQTKLPRWTTVVRPVDTTAPAAPLPEPALWRPLDATANTSAMHGPKPQVRYDGEAVSPQVGCGGARVLL